MKLIIKYIDNDIELKENEISAIEIENKRYFYRIVKDLYNIYDNELSEDIYLIDDNNKEINVSNKIKIFIDYFNFKLDSKKYTNDITKYINKILSEETKVTLLNQYKKIINLYKKELNNIDLPLVLDADLDIENITKLIKISINTNKELINNLFTLIDLENIFQTKNILVFINLKQYLSKEEIEELYKYSIYNGINLLLIDSQSYGTTLTNERKLIIDENLDEFML